MVERYSQGVTVALPLAPRLRLSPANGRGGRQYPSNDCRLTLAHRSRKIAPTNRAPRTD